MAFSRQSLRPITLCALVPVLLVAGCGRLEPHEAHEYVYVWVKGASLRDRVAVVSNRVAEVANGQRLQVVEEGHRFLKVKTDRGEIGWIEDHEVIDQRIYDEFAQMQKDHAHDPVVATGVLTDDYWLRDAPGRQSDRYYLLAENSRLQMLERASVPKPKPAQAVPVPVERPADTAKDRARGKAKSDAPPGPPEPDLEDYWLVRDSAGRVGWVRARTVDEDVPDAIAGLGEGQKIVGAYVLRTVDDPDANTPKNQVPEYVAVMAPWKDGLPYDFDQVRVFTWNTKKHRYETAYRERDISGYLPVTVGEETFGNQQEPVFSYRVATGDTVAVDPQTGAVKPGDTLTESYHMEGVMVRRIADPAGTANRTPVHSPAHAKTHRRQPS